MPYQTVQQTPKSYLKTLLIIYSGLIAGQVLFSAAVFSITKSTDIDLKNTNDPFLFVVPIMAIGSFIAGNFLFKQQLNMAVNKESLKGKLMIYQTALIIKCALLEGASLFGIVTYMLSKNFLFLLISILIILYFIIFRPTKDKISEDLNLSYEDKMMFDSYDLLV